MVIGYLSAGGRLLTVGRGVILTRVSSTPRRRTTRTVHPPRSPSIVPAHPPGPTIERWRVPRSARTRGTPPRTYSRPVSVKTKHAVTLIARTKIKEKKRTVSIESHVPTLASTASMGGELRSDITRGLVRKYGPVKSKSTDWTVIPEEPGGDVAPGVSQYHENRHLPQVRALTAAVRTSHDGGVERGREVGGVGDEVHARQFLQHRVPANILHDVSLIISNTGKINKKMSTCRLQPPAGSRRRRTPGARTHPCCS